MCLSFVRKYIFFKLREVLMIFSNKDESSTLKVIENTTTLREKSFSQKTETHFCWKLAYLSFLVDFVIRISNSGRLELILCKLINYSWIELQPSWNTKSNFQIDWKWKTNQFPIKVCPSFLRKWFLFEVWVFLQRSPRRYRDTLRPSIPNL